MVGALGEGRVGFHCPTTRAAQVTTLTGRPGPAPLRASAPSRAQHVCQAAAPDGCTWNRWRGGAVAAWQWSPRQDRPRRGRTVGSSYRWRPDRTRSRRRCWPAGCRRRPTGRPPWRLRRATPPVRAVPHRSPPSAPDAPARRPGVDRRPATRRSRWHRRRHSPVLAGGARPHEGRRYERALVQLQGMLSYHLSF